MQQTDPLSATFAALADPTRRAILARLAKGEASVKDLSEPFDMTQPAISKHLRVLERAGLIEQGRQAQWRPRRLRAGPLRDIADWVEPVPPPLGGELRTARRVSSANYRTVQEQGNGDDDDTRPESTEVAPTPRPSTPRAATSSSSGRSTPRASRSGRRSRTRSVVPKWWGKHGTTTTVVEMDVRPGGKWRYISSAPDRDDVTFYGEYLEVDPPSGYKWTFMFDVEGVGPMGGPETARPRGDRRQDEAHLHRPHGLGRGDRGRPGDRHGPRARSRPGTAWRPCWPRADPSDHATEPGIPTTGCPALSFPATHRTTDEFPRAPTFQG